MKKYFIIVILIITIGYFSNTSKKKIDRFILHKENNPIINVIEEQKPTPEPIVEQPKSHNSRMTSYWVGDDCNSEDMTASGKTTRDFELNDKGWYTWNDMLVIATASKRLGKTNQRTYRLYEEIYIKINDIVYKAVVLDVCGACMRDNRIDLFVKDRASMIDQQVEVFE